MGLQCEDAESREDVWKTKLSKGELISREFIPSRTHRNGASML